MSVLEESVNYAQGIFLEQMQKDVCVITHIRIMSANLRLPYRSIVHSSQITH